jgi:hypothetical protein
MHLIAGYEITEPAAVALFEPILNDFFLQGTLGSAVFSGLVDHAWFYGRPLAACEVGCLLFWVDESFGWQCVS